MKLLCRGFPIAATTSWVCRRCQARASKDIYVDEGDVNTCPLRFCSVSCLREEFIEDTLNPQLEYLPYWKTFGIDIHVISRAYTLKKGLRSYE